MKIRSVRNEYNTDKNIKTKARIIRTCKTTRKCISSMQSDGILKGTFYRFKELYENGGEEALHEISKKKSLLANRVSDDIERAVVNIATEFPAYGQQRAANELRKRGIIISQGGVSLYGSEMTLKLSKKRLKALETKK